MTRKKNKKGDRKAAAKSMLSSLDESDVRWRDRMHHTGSAQIADTLTAKHDTKTSQNKNAVDVFSIIKGKTRFSLYTSMLFLLYLSNNPKENANCHGRSLRAKIS